MNNTINKRHTYCGNLDQVVIIWWRTTWGVTRQIVLFHIITKTWDPEKMRPRGRVQAESEVCDSQHHNLKRRCLGAMRRQH